MGYENESLSELFKIYYDIHKDYKNGENGYPKNYC